MRRVMELEDKKRLGRQLQSLITKAERESCPSCDGKGMWLMPPDAHRSEGWVPCEACGGTGEKRKETKVAATKKPEPRAGLHSNRAGIHSNPKTGKVEKIATVDPKEPVLLIEVHLYNGIDMEAIEEALQELEGLGNISKAEIHNAPPSIKLR